MADPTLTPDSFMQSKTSELTPDQFMQQKTAQAPEMSFGKRMVQTWEGAARGLGHTLMDIGDITHTVTGGGLVDKVLDKVFPQQGKQIEESHARLGKQLQPTNPSQQAGYGAEQFLEFFVPTGTGEVKAAATAPRWVKMLVEAGKAAVDTGMKTFAQTKDPTAALKAAGIAAPLGAAGGLLSRAAFS